ncbi:MAG TPA: hypothetical protein VNA31_01140, partial [bacterium]|nr:hypothetical protein [bacterium]
MHQARVVTPSAKLEARAAQLLDAEAVEILRTYGIEEPGQCLIRIAYNCAPADDVFHPQRPRKCGRGRFRARPAPHERPVGSTPTWSGGFIRTEVVPWETLAKPAS